MTLLKQELSKGNFKSFETLHKFIEIHENCAKCDEGDLHLKTLSVSIIKTTFRIFLQIFYGLKILFFVEIDNNEIFDLIKQKVNNLTEILYDTDLKNVFETAPLINF